MPPQVRSITPWLDYPVEVALRRGWRWGVRCSTRIRYGHRGCHLQCRDREIQLGEERFELWFPCGEGVDLGHLHVKRLDNGSGDVVLLVGMVDRVGVHLVEVGTKLAVHGRDQSFTGMFPTSFIQCW